MLKTDTKHENTLGTTVESNMKSIQLPLKYEAGMSMDYSWLNRDITLFEEFRV
jgi:hypothetical protein